MEKTPSLHLPLYASKPQRRIPGTDVIAVTMYASDDRSVRQYSLFTADGYILGNISSHSSQIGGSAGYHLGTGLYSITRGGRTFRNLAEAAAYLLANKEA